MVQYAESSTTSSVLPHIHAAAFLLELLFYQTTNVPEPFLLDSDNMEQDHHAAAAHSDPSMEGSLEKETGGTGTGTANNPQHLENIRTVSRVPGNPHYYEKDGLRTYGDDEDHDHEPPVSRTAGTQAQIHMLMESCR
jgi:hypothetical protein